MSDERKHGSGRALTRREFEAVIQRASELASADPEGGEGTLDEMELFRIAGEVGLSPTHVRRALVEVRTREVPGNAIDRWFGGARIRVARVVPGGSDEIAATLDEFMVAGHLLQPIRRGSEVLLYRPAVDWLSNFARAGASMSQKVYWASAKEIEVRLESADEGQTLVELDVDAGVRGEYIAGGFIGGAAAGGGTGFGVGALLSALALGPAVMIPVAILVGGGVAGGVVWGTGRAARRRREEVQDELEGILDALERGEALNPPPASWRRWVQRQAKRFKVELFGDGSDFHIDI
jgi:hypothetical protein